MFLFADYGWAVIVDAVLHEGFLRYLLVVGWAMVSCVWVLRWMDRIRLRGLLGGGLEIKASPPKARVAICGCFHAGLSGCEASIGCSDGGTSPQVFDHSHVKGACRRRNWVLEQTTMLLGGQWRAAL